MADLPVDFLSSPHVPLKAEDPDQFESTESVKHFEDILDQTQATPANSKCWEPEHYAEYFDVTTELVATRLMRGLYPFSDELLGGGNPDLYGPVWVATTFVFTLIAASYFSLSAKGVWHFDLNEISVAAGVVYGCLAGVPLGVFCILTNSGSKSTYTEVVCLYGYALGVYVLACPLCVWNVAWLRWLALALATAWSAFVYIKHLWTEIVATHPGKPYLVCVVGLLGHVLIFFVSNFYFFKG